MSVTTEFSKKVLDVMRFAFMGLLLVSPMTLSITNGQINLSNNTSYHPQVNDGFVLTGNATSKFTSLINIKGTNTSDPEIWGQIINSTDVVMNTIFESLEEKITEVSTTQFKTNETMTRIDNATDSYWEWEIASYEPGIGWDNKSGREVGIPTTVVENHTVNFPYNESYIPSSLPMEGFMLIPGMRKIYLPGSIELPNKTVEGYQLQWTKENITRPMTINDLDFASISIEQWRGTNDTFLEISNAFLFPDFPVPINASFNIQIKIILGYEQATRMITNLKMRLDFSQESTIDGYVQDESGNLTDILVQGFISTNVSMEVQFWLARHDSLFLTLPPESNTTSITTTRPISTISTPILEFTLVVGTLAVIALNTLAKRKKWNKQY